MALPPRDCQTPRVWVIKEVKLDFRRKFLLWLRVQSKMTEITENSFLLSNLGVYLSVLIIGEETRQEFDLELPPSYWKGTTGNILCLLKELKCSLCSISWFIALGSALQEHSSAGITRSKLSSLEKQNN